MMEIIRNDWFVTPVWEVKTDFDSAFNDQLLRDVKNLKGGADNIWQIKSDALSYLKEYTSKIIKEATYDYVSGGRDFEYHHFRGWINSHPPGKSLAIHGHGAPKIVMTYYIKAPQNAGDLLIIDPRGGVDWDSQIDTKNGRVDGAMFKRIEPKEGHLVFFPGFLLHMVEENKSNDYRYSLTSNLGTYTTDDLKNFMRDNNVN